MSDKVFITVTPAQAKALWGIIDGAAAAGFCEGDLTKHELATCEKVCAQITDQISLTTLELKPRNRSLARASVLLGRMMPRK